MISSKNWLHNNEEYIVIRQYFVKIEEFDDSQKVMEVIIVFYISIHFIFLERMNHM